MVKSEDEHETWWQNRDNYLWQYIAKHHMEIMTGETITDEAWEVFVYDQGGLYGEACSRLAHEFWIEYDPEDIQWNQFTQCKELT